MRSFQCHQFFVHYLDSSIHGSSFDHGGFVANLSLSSRYDDGLWRFELEYEAQFEFEYQWRHCGSTSTSASTKRQALFVSPRLPLEDHDPDPSNVSPPATGCDADRRSFPGFDRNQRTASAASCSCPCSPRLPKPSIAQPRSHVVLVFHGRPGGPIAFAFAVFWNHEHEYEYEYEYECDG